MCQLKNIHKLACLFAVACVLMGQSLADDQDFMEEFLKREYSLAKPYRGEFTVSYVTLTQTFNVHSAKPRWNEPTAARLRIVNERFIQFRLTLEYKSLY